MHIAKCESDKYINLQTVCHSRVVYCWNESVTYLMATMSLGTLSICMTVLILNVHHLGSHCRMPPWLRHFAFVYLARFLNVRTRGCRLPVDARRTFPVSHHHNTPMKPTTDVGAFRAAAAAAAPAAIGCRKRHRRRTARHRRRRPARSSADSC